MGHSLHPDVTGGPENLWHLSATCRV